MSKIDDGAFSITAAEWDYFCKRLFPMTPQLESQIRDWAANSEGWTTTDRCVEMAQLVLDVKPDTVVEIGVFGGRSFIPQALALKEVRKATGQIGHIYGIDAWKKEATVEGENEANREWWLAVDIHHIHKLAVEAVWKYQVDEHAIIIRAASQHCGGCVPTIDVLFIDGNHSEVASCRDAAIYLPKLKQGGYLWVDDCDWDSTKAMQKMVEAQCKIVKDSGAYKLFRKL